MKTIDAVLALMLGTTAIAAGAQPTGWKPDKNVEIVVGLTAGSNQDRIGRTIQRLLQEKSFINVTSSVVNRVGGGGSVAWAFMSQHPGDGHYFQIASPSMVTNHITGHSSFNYTDFTPIAMLGSQYVALAVQPNSPIKNGRDLIDRLRKDPTSLAFGSNGLGNALHILIAMVAKHAGADARKLKVVAFGGNELITALLGGHVDVISTVTSNIVPHMQAGKMRMLAVAAPRRLGGVLADVPTWRELGVDAVVSNWSAVVGTKSLSPAQIAYWDDVFGRLVKTEEWKQDLERNLWENEYLNSADTTKFLRSDYAQLKAALSELGMAK